MARVRTANTNQSATEPSRPQGRRLRSRAWTLAACLAVTLAASPARAQVDSAPAPTPAEIGRDHFDQGVKEYNLGHFNEAIAEFEKAYKADPAPIMLFNIAQSHRQLGNKERALFFYRRYLEQAPPDAPNRSEVEQRTKDLAQSLEQEKDLKQKPPTEVAGLESGHPPPTTGGAVTASAQPAGTEQPAASVQAESSATPSESDKTWTVAACLAPSFASVDRGSVQLPVMFAFRIGAGYSFPLPSARLIVALDAVLALLPYQTDGAPPANKTSTLPGAILSGEYMQDLTSRFSIGGGVGFGVIWWTGLAQGNPFVNPGIEVTGAIPMPSFAAEIRATMNVSSDLFVILAPELLYSRATSGLSNSLSGLWRFDVNLGAGYRF